MNIEAQRFLTFSAIYLSLAIFMAPLVAIRGSVGIEFFGFTLGVLGFPISLWVGLNAMGARARQSEDSGSWGFSAVEGEKKSGKTINGDPSET